MPRGDGTGPEGNGPLTGRGLGDCSKSSKSGLQTRKPGLCRRLRPGGVRGNQQRRMFGLTRMLRRRFRGGSRG